MLSAITRNGSVYFEMGNYQEAVKNYDKAIQLGKDDSKVIIPEGNKRYLAKISHEIKGVLTIKTISHASRVLNIVFINIKLVDYLIQVIFNHNYRYFD